MYEAKPHSELGLLTRESKALQDLDDSNDRCAYCGMRATDNEHIVPYSYLSPVEKRVKSLRSYKKYIVRSCHSCNGYAGNKMFKNFWEKKKYIAERVRIKNKKLLKMPEWRNEELEQLEGRLLRHVFANQTNKKLLEIRLENLEKPEIIGVKEYE